MLYAVKLAKVLFIAIIANKNREPFNSANVNDRRSFLADDIKVTRILGESYEQILLLLSSGGGHPQKRHIGYRHAQTFILISSDLECCGYW